MRKIFAKFNEEKIWKKKITVDDVAKRLRVKASVIKNFVVENAIMKIIN